MVFLLLLGFRWRRGLLLFLLLLGRRGFKGWFFHHGFDGLFVGLSFSFSLKFDGTVRGLDPGHLLVEDNGFVRR